MPKNPPTGTGGSYDHAPLAAGRIRPGDYAVAELERMKIRNEVMAVDENWDPKRAAPPHGINWVIYPNGDLLRIGFD